MAMHSSRLQASKKHNTKNAVPIGEDLGIFKKAAQIPVSGRKALRDVTNSVKPSSQKQGLKKGKQAIAFAEDEKFPYSIAEDEKFPYSIAEEGFLHPHDECIKSQKKSMGLDEFLKIIGLDEDVGFQSVSASDQPMMTFETLEEIPEPKIEDRRHAGVTSPMCGSPNSPKLSYMNMKDYDDFPSFVLTESPKRSK